MSALGQSVFLKALAWALLDSIWQFGILFLILLSLSSLKKSMSPARKHGISLLLLITGAAWFTYGLLRHYSGIADPGGLKSASASLQHVQVFANFYLPLKTFVGMHINYVSFIYLLFVLAFSIRFLHYFYHFHQFRTTGITKLRASLRMQVEQLASQLGIRRKVHVWISSLVDTPMIIGFLKPTILIPVASINYLSVQQLEAILLHELAHIKRNDYLVNLFVITLEIAFFFNPFARLLIRSIKQERENSCDDWVLQFRFDRHQYASALLALEQGRSSYLSGSIAATGRNSKRLLLRVQRIMQVTVKNDYRFPYFSYLLVGVIVFVAVMMNGAPVIKHEAVTTDQIKKSSVLVHTNRIGMESPAAMIIYPNRAATTVQEQKPARQLTVTSTGRHRQEVPVVPDGLSIYINDIIESSREPAAYLAALEATEQDFSIADPEPPTPPVAAELDHFPFVPNSSFSFNILEDTTEPKKKKESYHERIARESLIQAKVAFDRIDWKHIEKQLKTKLDVDELRKEIEQSLEDLNWQEINDEVKASTSKEAMENLKADLRKEYEEMKKFERQQQHFRLIQKDLQEQQEKHKRAAEKQVIEIQQQLSKTKVIVHI